jgi:hypothetical protein
MLRFIALQYVTYRDHEGQQENTVSRVCRTQPPFSARGGARVTVTRDTANISPAIARPSTRFGRSSVGYRFEERSEDALVLAPLGLRVQVNREKM